MPAVLAAVFLLAASPPASACMSLPVNVAGDSRVFMPDAPNHWTSPVGRMRAGHPAYLRLGLRAKGDRWELPKSGTEGHLAWKAESEAGGGYTLWFLARDGGQEALRLNYVFANGQSSSVQYILIIEPPPPPPKPWVLTVDKDGYRSFAQAGQETVLRMALPLPDGRHWKVREASVTGHGGTNRQPLALEPVSGQADTFRFISQAGKAHMVFEETGENWLLFPDTVDVELTVESFVPKC